MGAHATIGTMHATLALAALLAVSCARPTKRTPPPRSPASQPRTAARPDPCFASQPRCRLSVSRCEANCDQDAMELGLGSRPRAECHRQCGEKLPLCGRPACAFVPRHRFEVFRSGRASRAGGARHPVKTEALRGLDLDGKKSMVCRVPRLLRNGQRQDVQQLSWELYLLDARGCARHVGQYRGAGRPSPSPIFNKGLRSFTVRVWPLDAPDPTLLRTYVFDGVAYREGRSGLR